MSFVLLFEAWFLPLYSPEFEALKRLGISDAKGYLKRHFPEEQLTFVPGACVGQLFIDQIDAIVDDALANGGLVDVSVSFL